MPLLSFIASAIQRSAKYMGHGATIALAFLVLTAVVDVVSRAATGHSTFYGLLEYGEIALVALVFLSMARTELDDGHVSSSLLTDRLARDKVAFVRGLGLIAISGALIWAAVVAGHVAWHSFETNETRFGLVRIPLWPARAAVPLGLGSLGLLTFCRGLRCLAGRL